MPKHTCISLLHANVAFRQMVCMVIFDWDEYADLRHTLAHFNLFKSNCSFQTADTEANWHFSTSHGARKMEWMHQILGSI